MRLRLNIIKEKSTHKVFFCMKETLGKHISELKQAIRVFLKEYFIIGTNESIISLDIDGFEILNGLLIEDILKDHDLVK